MDLLVSPIAGLLQTIIQEAHAENQRRHEEKMAQIVLIANSELRDSYVQQLLRSFCKFYARSDRLYLQNGDR